MNSDIASRLRDYADSPALNGTVPMRPGTLHVAADEIERVRAESHRNFVRANQEYDRAQKAEAEKARLVTLIASEGEEIALLREALSEVLATSEVVIAISDRKHDAWDKAKAAIAKARGRLSERTTHE